MLTLAILASTKATHTMSKSDIHPHRADNNQADTKADKNLSQLTPNASNGHQIILKKNHATNLNKSFLALAATVAGCTIRTSDRNNLFPRNRWIPSSLKYFLLASMGCPLQV